MRIHYQDGDVTLLLGDAIATLSELPARSANCAVTSPPYLGMRDYGVAGQYGLESSPSEYVKTMRAVFSEVHRVLADDATLWLNVADKYDSSDTKNLLGMPWRLAFALQEDGWILRNDIIWHKPNAMPEPYSDRMSGRFEYVFLFAKQPKYYLRLDAYRLQAKSRPKPPKGAGRGPDKYAPSSGLIPEQGRGGANETGARGVNPKGVNPGDVWSIPTQPLHEDHPGAFPVELPSRCVAMGCKPGGTVLDPFSGAGTTGLAALRFHRKYVGIDISAKFHDIALRRMGRGIQS